ncbi:hypothetical protein SEA_SCOOBYDOOBYDOO_21 [Mycobacterium phage ScoobyDoobyDoo]|nr:hypothetical protein SEA_SCOOBYDOOBYDOO_21 [Mycobacterium phage ScoobyDoobyDoo]
MPAPRRGVALWTGKVLPSTSAAPREQVAPKPANWKTGDPEIDRKRAHYRLRPHLFVVEPGERQCHLCGGLQMAKDCGRLLHPDPTPVRPQRPAWTPPVAEPVVKPKRARPKKTPEEVAEAARKARERRIAKIQAEQERLGREQEQERIQREREYALRVASAREATTDVLFDDADYLDVWWSEDGRYMVEKVATRLGDGRYAPRYSVTDMRQRTAKKKTVTVETFEEAETMVRYLAGQ